MGRSLKNFNEEEYAEYMKRLLLELMAAGQGAVTVTFVNEGEGIDMILDEFYEDEENEDEE